MMNPMSCIGWSTELQLRKEAYQQIETYTLPSGLTTYDVFVREFTYKVGWKTKSESTVWMIWIQSQFSEISPRMVCIVSDDDLRDRLKHLSLVEGQHIYLIQHYIDPTAQ